MSDSKQFGAGARPQMEDLSEAPERNWSAQASARVRMKAETLVSIVAGQIPGGDVLAVASLSGITGAKQAAMLVPVRQARTITYVVVEFAIDSLRQAVEIVARVKGTGRGPVVTEALAGAFAAALSIYDMCSAVDGEISIEYLRPAESIGTDMPGSSTELEPAREATVEESPRLRVITGGTPFLELTGPVKKKPKSKAKNKAKTKRRPKPKAKSAAKAKPKSKARSKPKRKPKAKTRAKVKLKIAKPRAKAKAKPKARAKAKPKTRAKAKPKAKAKSKLKTNSRPKAKARTKAKSKPKARTKSKAKQRTR
jgi:molybdenum cofactor biosynthesis protein MoaC